MRQWMVLAVLVALSLPAPVTMSQAPAIGQEISGTLRPTAPPREPVRRIVGKGCVVDLEQSYSVDGSLTGKMNVDFRIFVAGDCTQPPGTHDEHWIAYGTFTVRDESSEYSGTLIYLAGVKAAGTVSGRITLDGELSAELAVAGTFEDGLMRYQGMRLNRTD